MCGITGIINLSQLQFGLSEKKLFRDLLVATSLRGKHSTGMFTVPIDNNKTVSVLKRAVSAGQFIDTEQFTTIMKDFNNYKYVLCDYYRNKQSKKYILWSVNDTWEHDLETFKIKLSENYMYLDLSILIIYFLLKYILCILF